MSPQTRAMLDESLRSINADVVQMAELVRSSIGGALDCFRSRDRKLASRIVENDERINKLRFAVEDACVANIARQQPAARDLRELLAAMNIVLDLERMGDHAAGIAKTVLRVEPGDPGIEIPDALFQMRDLAVGMLEDVMRAFQEHDLEAAREISQRDDEVDQGYRKLYLDVLEALPNTPRSSEYALYLLFAGHNLERIADRVTNIAERIVFAAIGEVEELNVREEGVSGTS